MKRTQVNKYKQGTPEYVIMHARYQRHRGRRPAAWYRGIRNPGLALKLALKDLPGVRPFPGDEVSEFCHQMARAAVILGRPINTTFNDIPLHAVPGVTGQRVYAEWNQEMNRRQAEYQASPAYAAQQEANRRDIAEKQAQVDVIVARLMNGKVRTLEDVLIWSRDLTDPADRIGVKIPFGKICELFGAMGFRAGMYYGDEFDENDPDIFALWIIGQVFDAFTRGHGPHPMITKFIDDWFERFRKGDEICYSSATVVSAD